MQCVIIIKQEKRNVGIYLTSLGLKMFTEEIVKKKQWIIVKERKNKKKLLDKTRKERKTKIKQNDTCLVV